MFEYRVTKYNPAIRSEGRQYCEWTSISDVGTTFDGQVLTQPAYEEVEAAYLAVATAFLREAEAGSLSIRGLEDRKNNGASYAEGDAFAPMDARAIMAQVLREELWCRLEGDRAFVHFGYDYYMYVGVETPCPMAQRLAVQLGLFVEEMRSPYHPESDSSHSSSPPMPLFAAATLTANNGPPRGFTLRTRTLENQSLADSSLAKTAFASASRFGVFSKVHVASHQSQLFQRFPIHLSRFGGDGSSKKVVSSTSTSRQSAEGLVSRAR